MAYWVPEMENVPARVTLIEVPGRKELCAKNLFNVASCKMQWQKNGDYLCVKVDRYSKAKRMEDKDQMKYSVSCVCVSFLAGFLKNFSKFYVERGGVIVWRCITVNKMCRVRR